MKNKQKKELNIYAEKKEEEESINGDNKKNKWRDDYIRERV